MVWAGVMSDGKQTPLIVIPEGVKINQLNYPDLLKLNVLPWIKNEHRDTLFIFMQEGAPADTAPKVISWCQANFPDFWDKLMWPPSSPDLNVIDFAMSSILEAKTCKISLSRCPTLLSEVIAERYSWGSWEWRTQDLLTWHYPPGRLVPLHACCLQVPGPPHQESTVWN